MVSGERRANWASSFLRNAGASCAAATLRWMTRPARSSRIAGSGIPATTALTAGVSTGLTRRTSSREATALCRRHGTIAAAAMQPNTTSARAADNSPNTTRAASARHATSRMTAECRNRSGQGDGGEEEVEGASTAIEPASPFGSSSGAGIAALPDKGGFGRRAGLEPERRLPQALGPGAENNLPKRQQDYRDDERRKIIEHAEQQHSREQLLAVHLPKADQHGGVEDPEPSRRVAGEAQQRCRHVNDRDHDEAEF